MKLDADLLKAIDEVLDPIVERDPAKTQSARADASLTAASRRAARRRARVSAGRSAPELEEL